MQNQISNRVRTSCLRTVLRKDCRKKHVKTSEHKVHWRFPETRLSDKQGDVQRKRNHELRFSSRGNNTNKGSSEQVNSN